MKGWTICSGLERADLVSRRQGDQRNLYRTIGYRVCAERAVRVDILRRRP
jgi:hypothetical protein